MNFQQAITTCLRKYVDFSGRATRSEFWWFVLFNFVLSIVTSMLGQMISSLVSLALLVPSLAVGARRLHDIGKSGWLQLLWFIPIIGWAILIYWACQPSGPANVHGGAEAAPDAPTVMPGQQ